MKKIIGLISLVLVGLAIVLFANSTKHPYAYHPPNGFVPDEQTAIRIAEDVWVPIYGKAVIDGEKPFYVHLQNGVWIVTGKQIPKDGFGGVAVAEISKQDGRIIRVSHGE